MSIQIIGCVLVNHDFVNEVQTVAQLFFPGARFSFICEGQGSGFEKTSVGNVLKVTRPEGFVDTYPQGYVIRTVMDETTAQAHIIHNGSEITRYELPFEALPLYLTPRRVLMLALYHALQKAVGAYTPWGALTGIRPSKMVREWLEDGWLDEKVIATMQDPFCVTPEKARLALTVAKAEMELTARIYAQQCCANTAPQPVGIYISIPFCPTRCVYCSFNTSHKPAKEDTHARYIAAISNECKAKAAQLREINGIVSSIYIGGGTPTVLSENLLAQLLATIAETFDTGEYSVEAGRPDTLTLAKLKLLKSHGVNRIAVNPQTLNDTTLALIGRNHTAADFFTAFHAARDAGFACINTDIIAGLPGETPDDMRRTMAAITDLSPENITVHTLAVKRASHINEFRSQFTLPTAQATEEMLDIAAIACHEAGLSPYYLYRQKNMVGMFENIGYSKPGYECLYNVGMMAEVQTVLGIGAGAVSKFVTGNKITREFNAKDPGVYMERNGI